MWIRSVGPIDERLTLLGTWKNCVYLLKGDHHALIGGAAQWAIPDLERQFRELSIDMDRIRYLLISHSHFDHCGAVPHVREKYPHIQVVGSRGAAAIFEMEKAIRNMRKFSRQATQLARASAEEVEVPVEWTRLRLDRIVGDGDTLELGRGVRLQVFEAPGHSRCSLMAFEPRERFLFPGDALHFPSEDGTHLVCTASESFAEYIKSLEKVVHLRPELCAWEHHGARTKEDAHDVVRHGMAFTESYRDGILEALGSGADSEELAEELCQEWVARSGFFFMPRPVLLHIIKGMVAHAAHEDQTGRGFPSQT